MPPGERKSRLYIGQMAERLAVNNFIEEEILEGRQVYMCLPFIPKKAQLLTTRI